MLLKSVVVLGAGVVYAKAACDVAVAPAWLPTHLFHQTKVNALRANFIKC